MVPAATAQVTIVMETENHIVIAALREVVFDLAARVERWPALLPHYRYVHVLAGDDHRRIVEMAAHRDGFPVRWTAIQEILPGEFKVRFRHIRGVTRGMEVEWRLEEQNGSVYVTLWHRFDPPWPVLGPPFARYVVGSLFVRNIAGKTLRHLKRHAEQSGGHSREAR